jgi:hypothetical protein
MSEPQQSAKWYREGPGLDHLLLLVSLVVVLLILPLFEGVDRNREVLSGGMEAILLIGLILARKRRYVFIPGIVLVAFEVPLTWLSLVWDQPVLFLLSCVATSVLFAALSVFILVRVLNQHATEIYSVFGAVSSYLLLGLAWAVLYWAIDLACADAFAFNNRVTVDFTEDAEGATVFSQLVYFSFVTMSTLGYGDITPRIPVVQTLAWLQAVTGQFFMAVAVAWLVSSLRVRPAPSTAQPEDGP